MELLKPKCLLAKLVKIDILNDSNFCYHFQLPNVQVNMKPGQFIMAKFLENGIRVPIYCIQDHNYSFKVIVSKYKEQDKLFLNLNINDYLDCLMPLGRTVGLNEAKDNLICVTEEFLMFAYTMAKTLIENKKKVKVILSFHKARNICYLEAFKNLNISQLIVICDEATNDIQNHVSLSDYLDEANTYADWVYLAVNNSLVKSLDNWFCSHKVSGNILYKEFMACGFGICNGCTVVKKNNTVQKCCLNPFFKFGEIAHE